MGLQYTSFLRSWSKTQNDSIRNPSTVPEAINMSPFLLNTHILSSITNLQENVQHLELTIRSWELKVLNHLVTVALYFPVRTVSDTSSYDLISNPPSDVHGHNTVPRDI